MKIPFLLLRLLGVGMWLLVFVVGMIGRGSELKDFYKLIFGIKPITTVDINFENHCKGGSGSALCELIYEYRDKTYLPGQPLPFDEEFLDSINPFVRNLMDAYLCVKSEGFPYLIAVKFDSKNGFSIPVNEERGCIAAIIAGKKSNYMNDDIEAFVPIVNRNVSINVYSGSFLNLASEVATNTGSEISKFIEGDHHKINIYFKIPLHSMIMLYMLALLFIGISVDGLSKVKDFIFSDYINSKPKARKRATKKNKV